MPEVLLNDARLYYRESGEGFPLVFTHGLGGDHTNWNLQVPAFRERYRVVVWDCRGHGRSEVTASGYTIGGFVDDLGALLDHLGIARAHLAGLSMGGWITWRFALAHPERCAALALSDSAGVLEAATPEEIEKKKSLFLASAAIAEKQGRAPLVDATLALMFSPQFLAANPAAVLPVRRRIEADPGLGYARTIRGLFANLWDRPEGSGFDQLGRLAAPTLVLAGELDQLTPLPTQRALARAIPGTRLEIIPRAGHVPCIEQPELWNRLVGEFLVTVPV